ncbi:hypothetical protein [Brytella acorum]|uniref:Uncharacterized protein n=1 Tax=Brytella acorum TaxID=2959299 RepID=A0AA35UK13_9PROT|nr:hypothetical protein [Brytella acorum]MDF3623777.1 hypothetical protein [Brytella acorum]CAI9121805.1 hypothetical protein LMG32879_002658 [Brytella acorum]
MLALVGTRYHFRRAILAEFARFSSPMEAYENILEGYKEVLETVERIRHNEVIAHYENVRRLSTSINEVIAVSTSFQDKLLTSLRKAATVAIVRDAEKRTLEKEVGHLHETLLHMGVVPCLECTVTLEIYPP